MANKILQRLADEYVVHFDHKEVQNDVDGSQKDHKDLLERDQNCVEKVTGTDNLDSSNTGNCECDLCEHNGVDINRIAARIAHNNLQKTAEETNCFSPGCGDKESTEDESLKECDF